jgi:chromosome segregation ATPase
VAELDTISSAIGSVAQVRARLERETAAIAERSALELAALDAAIGRVRAEHARLIGELEDERERLLALAQSAERDPIQLAGTERHAEQLRRRIAGQEKLVAALSEDVARSEEAQRNALADHAQFERRGRMQQRAFEAQLREALKEAASLAASRGEAEGALTSAPPPPDVARYVAEVEIQRGDLEAKLEQTRAERDAIQSEEVDPAARSLNERLRVVRQEERQRLDAQIATLEAELAALAAEERRYRNDLAQHAAYVRALNADAESARERLEAAHQRYAAVERAMREAAERNIRAGAAAEATAAAFAASARDIELGLEAERVRLEELRTELGIVERSADEVRERLRATRLELEEERELRRLMVEVGTVEVALEAALVERDRLDRLVDRMRAAGVR